MIRSLVFFDVNVDLKLYYNFLFYTGSVLDRGNLLLCIFYMIVKHDLI